MNKHLLILMLATCATALRAAPLVIRTPLAEARAAVAALKARGPLPAGGIVVEIPGGVYPLDTTIALTAADGGTAESPVVWRASGGTRVILTGGLAVADWKPVTDPVIAARLHPVSRAHILAANLRATGLTDFGQIEQRGNPGLELFFAGRRMQLARYPNAGWLLTAGVPQTGPRRFHEGLDRERRFDGVPAGRHYGRIAYAEDRPATWAARDDIYVHGYWTWDWSDSFQRIQSIDSTKSEITLAEPHHHYGYAPRQRYCFLNVLEELDQPGEWYLDRRAGMIYFYPPSPIGPDSIVVSVLSRPLVTLDSVGYFALEGFGFEHSRGSGLVITGGEYCRIAGSVFRNLGGEAMVIEGGRYHQVVSCDFHELANGAIRVAGGDRLTLEPSRHEILNNHIRDYGQWLRTAQYGVMIDGVGQRLAHNLIHDAPFEGIYLRGNDHLIEFNEVYRVCTETGDAGAFHTGRDYTWQGNVIRYNYWHHLDGPGGHDVTAVYLDDFSSGFEVHGNIFYRAGRGIRLGGGRDNTIANNLFIECAPAIAPDARGLSWAAYFFDGRNPWLADRFREVNGDQPPYVTRYPKLKTILQDEPAVPKGNVIRNNLSWGSGRWCDASDFYAFDFHRIMGMKDNGIADVGFMRRRPPPDTVIPAANLVMRGQRRFWLTFTREADTQREFAGNVLAAEAPGTFDPRTLRFTRTPGSPFSTIEFETIPVGQIGLQRDPWRPTVPERLKPDSTAPMAPATN